MFKIITKHSIEHKGIYLYYIIIYSIQLNLDISNNFYFVS